MDTITTESVFLNGEFIPLDAAKISVLDRGFLFGDGVYEVIPAYRRKLFRVTEHLQRLNNSLQGIRVNNPHSTATWIDLFQRLLAPHSTEDMSIYLQVTRGIQAKRDHAFPNDLVPTVFIMASPIHYASHIANGVSAITLDDIRWSYCHLKAITLLPNVLLRQQAVDNDCAEAILIKDGFATEGAATNVFIVDANGTLKTPPKNNAVLPGITRDLVLELAGIHTLKFEECQISEAQLHSAAEIWITSSTKEIVPIVRLNNKTIGNGKPGPLWVKMTAFYAAYKDKIRRGEVT